MFKKFIFVSSLVFLFSFPIYAANELKMGTVIINEIAWMGTKNSYSDEWIELYNNTDYQINLAGWVLKSADGKPKINLDGTISANGFYLLERKDDTTIPDIKADQIYEYKEVLGNSGENLNLYDNSGNLINSADFSSGWAVGDNKTKQTMEKNKDKWETSRESGGTPKAKNSVESEPARIATLQNVAGGQNAEPAIKIKIKEKEQVNLKEKIKITVKPIIYPKGIIINEIMPSPDGPDEENEWIELYNKNNFEADISGWKIKDTEGTAGNYIFPEKTKIKAKNFLVLTRPKSKIILNNGGDGLKLIQPDGKIADNISYKKAPRQESYSRTANGWQWSSAPTPGTKNIIPLPQKENEKEPTKEISSGDSKFKKGLAAGGYPFLKNKRENNLTQFSVFLPAIILAIFSGIMILFLKRKIVNNKRSEELRVKNEKP